MNRTLFTKKTKLADLIHVNYQLLYVLPRFGIHFGLGEATVDQICQKRGISLPLFLSVCNVYAFEDYIPDDETLSQIPLDLLVQYLRDSHKDYKEQRIPQIIKKTLEIVDPEESKYRKLLEQFCEKYREEAFNHFNYEEEVVFPYVAILLQGEKKDDYSIEDYEKTHSNIEESVNDLKNIIIKYLPANDSFKKSREVLLDLFLFEDDLNRHSLLEDKILVSLVERIEKKIK